jgi:hypothetical protein
MTSITKRFYPLAVATLSLAPLVSFAQDTERLQTTVTGVLGILNVVVTIVFVIAVIIFGWGIVKLIFAAGDPEAIKKAKGFLLWGVIGIAVLASVFGIITYLQEFFGVVPGTGTIAPPSIEP